MQVDPATGLPTEQLDHGGTFSQQVVQSAVPPDSKLFRMAEHLPSATQTVGWNAYRGANTITKGTSWNIPGSRPVGNGMFGGAGPATLHPANWTRMPTHGSLDAFDDASRKAYRPFNTLSGKGANTLASKGVSKALNSNAVGARTAARLQKWQIMSADEIAAVKGGARAPDMVSGGVLSRISASAKIAGWGDSTQLANTRMAGNAAKFLGGTDSSLMKAAQGIYGEGLGSASRAEMADLVSASSRGRLSQFVGGYLRGADGLGLRTSDVLMGKAPVGKVKPLLNGMGIGRGGEEAAAKVGLRPAFMRGAAMAEHHLADAGIQRVAGKYVATGLGRIGLAEGGGLVAKEGLEVGAKVGVKALGRLAMEEGGMKIAAKAGVAMGGQALGMAIPGVNVVMAAWTAYDLTKMGMEAMAGAGTMALEGFKSFQGSLYKPTMGMGYRDSEAAATSRARGVMAIQNSRLNARSILGSEAGAMAAHFS